MGTKRRAPSAASGSRECVGNGNCRTCAAASELNSDLSTAAAGLNNNIKQINFAPITGPYCVVMEFGKVRRDMRGHVILHYCGRDFPIERSGFLLG